MKTRHEQMKIEKMQSLPSSIGTDINNAAREIMYAIERETEKENRDEVMISRLIKAARLLPTYLPELQKYF